ncbi:MAG: xanthine dehydrogenase YagR molybdenum-binding subunit [Gaiellaceae bacterium]|jgi:xanthine dehydrogenase YagR molybdenum-binding subunit|nr:xanthine dehydrogenase YagR molybdenum-binding subunit [Gaiellaceae bacterium]
MARLIKTEKEVEGRFTEQWIVVEEDALQQWPEGPLTVVGRPATKVDGLARARGEARYTQDLRLPGMLHAAVLRSPHARAHVTRIDLGPALEAPGVRGALGPADLDALTDEPNYEGQAVAAVVAETIEQAQAAVELIDVEWEELEPLLDPHRALEEKSFVSDPRDYERGDVERGFAEADAVVEAEYTTQSVLHNALETHQSACEWEGDTLVVYTSTQYLWGVRSEVADALGLPHDKVRVICRFMGGGFGAKASAGDFTYVAAEFAKRTGRPVHCRLTRREENVNSGNRNPTIQKLRVGARADGTLTAISGEYLCLLGWDGWLPPTAGPAQMLYACENVHTVEYGVRTNSPPMDAFRAPGYVEGTFGLECLLDELAAKLDLDPLELRRKNHADHDPQDDRPFSSKQLMECYRRVEPHWDRRHEVRARSEGPWQRGVGLATQLWYGAGGPPSYAWVRMGGHAHVTVVTGMQDIGTGTRTAMAQIAAEELGLPLERVTVELGDTAHGPYAVVSGGSSTTPSMGPAVRAAAADLGRQIIEIAAQRFHVEERVLSLKGGEIVNADGGSWPLEEITGLLEDGQILGKGARGPNPTGMKTMTYGIQVAEVAVDVETGEVVVDRIYAVHDVGRVINPLGAESQIEGGIIQAIGHTLTEQRLLDPQTGKVLTRTLDAYKLPTIADVPEIVCELVDVPDAHLTNLGSKGLGEPPIVPTAAAIANAIRDATGADVRSLPITREEMLNALRDAEAREKEKRGAAATV